MTQRPLDILFLGLSLSSSWGNGHATTFRSLMRGLHALGHKLTFLERVVPWYSGHRDLPEADFCELAYYDDVTDLTSTHADKVRRADVVIIGSFVPEGVAVINAVATRVTGVFCFYDIDTPVTLSKLLAGDDEYIAPCQIPLFDIYFSFTGGPTLERLRTEFQARRAEPLYCSVDETRYTPTGETPQWDLGYLGTYSPDRQPALKRLLVDVAEQLPDRRFVVAGSRYPTTTDWPENVERIDHLPPSKHASFYSRQRFTLNVTRADMVAAGWSPSVRLFEAAACDCPVISDNWAGLDAFFSPGDAIHVARKTQDVCQILTVTDEQQRSAVAERARNLVLQAHTGTARARDLLRCLSTIGDTDRARTQAA
jgi:spore maturation protein CgeB